MKRILLLCTAIAISIGAIAQVKESFPIGFRKAAVPAHLKKACVEQKVPMRKVLANDEPTFNNTNQVPFRIAPSPQNTVSSDFSEAIGYTKYDLQTNNSISNRLIWNADGTISACWTFSPDAQTTTTPPYPNRGTGYNYWDGTAWNFTYPPDPSVRTEATRTGFTNIVVTPSGHEMTIAHQAVPSTTFNRLAVNYRATKGTGNWTLSYPWGSTGFDTWAKACSGLTNENIYVIWNGSGAAATTTSPPNIVNGQNGPLAFGRSTDGGVTWDPVHFIPEIDSAHYDGFGGDSYAIDARGDTVAISVGDQFTDILLLKSFDAGNTWTKTVIQKHPIPHYNNANIATFYIGNDTIPDTVYSNGGDSKVIIDNTGQCHVFFSALNYHDADSTDDLYNPHSGTDNLFYWNESMGEDTTTVWDPNTGGHGNYVAIAAAEDFNGDSVINTPVDTLTTCNPGLPWGSYQGGITQMPSCGIDETGRIYVAYQTINELADTNVYKMCHRHMYMMSLEAPYDPANWTVPYNIVVDIAHGGNGENEECVFGCMARRVDKANSTCYILYQRDAVPGHSLATANTCDHDLNLNVVNEQILCKVDINAVGINDVASSGLYVGQNYPNPADGRTSIDIGLKKSVNVKVEISDLIGRVVYSESKGKMISGNHTLTLNTSNLKNGVYTYTVIAGDAKTTRKMIVQ